MDETGPDLSALRAWHYLHAVGYLLSPSQHIDADTHRDYLEALLGWLHRREGGEGALLLCCRRLIHRRGLTEEEREHLSDLLLLLLDYLRPPR